MKENMHAHAYLLFGLEDNPRALFLTFTFSIICHLIFFAVLILAPGYKPYSKYTPSVINVRMVALPAYDAAQGSGGEIAIKQQKQVPRQKKAQVSKKLKEAAARVTDKSSKAVSIAPKSKKIKKSLKKKTFKSSKVVKSAIAAIEKKVEDSRQDPVAEAIDRLKTKVEKSGRIGQPGHKIGKGTVRPGAGITGGSGAGDKHALELIDIYRVEIAYQIQKNWAFSESLAGGRTDLVVELAFTVMPGGEIKDIWFDTRSGNRYLDESAYKAVMKSNPVNPHPSGLSEKVVYVGLRFGPKGLD